MMENESGDTSLNGRSPYKSRSYGNAASLRRMLFVMANQMKLISKTWLMPALIMLMVLYGLFAPILAEVFSWNQELNLNSALCNSMIFMSPAMAFVCALVCSGMLSNEFNERSVYLSIPMPVSRRELYFGKFLSGLIISLGMTVGIYGLGIVVLSQTYDLSYPSKIWSSLVIALLSVFFLCCFSYGLGSFLKKLPELKVMTLSVAVIPMIMFGLSISKTTAFMVGFFPWYGFSLTLSEMWINPTSIFEAVVSTGVWVSVVSTVLLSAVFLIAGFIYFERRDL